MLSPVDVQAVEKDEESIQNCMMRLDVNTKLVGSGLRMQQFGTQDCEGA
jgi:hypothetical protein